MRSRGVRLLEPWRQQMERRNFLKTAAAFALGTGIGIGHTSNQFGWRPPSKPDVITPKFANSHSAVVGQGEDRISLIYKYYQMGKQIPLFPLNQQGPDCTSKASGMGVELVEILQYLFKQSTYKGPIATEILHIGGRSVVGGRNYGGVAISETVEFMREYGVLFRKDYSIMDFTHYNYNKCVIMGNKIPEPLLKECSKHKIKTATFVSTWDEARDAISSLQPVILGSMVGFDPPRNVNILTRDRDGFAEPNGSWAHAWLLIGIKDSGRKGGCILSSWGKNWVKGPKGYNQPDGSIWVDKKVLEQMISKYGDCYAINTLTNLEKEDYRIWK